MFRNGKIKTYDSERGTGSIELADDAQELSFRLQDLPSPEIDPQIGELLKFRMIPHQETIILDNMVRLDVKVQDEFVAEVVALPSLAPTISTNWQSFCMPGFPAKRRSLILRKRIRGSSKRCR